MAATSSVGIDLSSLADYTIRTADPDQLEAHGRAGYVHWHHGVSWETYWNTLRRERDDAIWGKDGRLLTWALVRRDDPDGEIYAACETYRRKGWVKRRGSDEVEDTYIYGIASVVTPKQHLRNGYATRFLSLLHHQLGASLSFPANWGPEPPNPPAELVPPGAGSILWSDVGADFYSRCTVGLERPGWLVDGKQSSELVWSIRPSPPRSADSAGSKASWQWIYESDLPAIAERLSAETKDRIMSADTSEHAVFLQDPASEGTLTFVPVKGSWYKPPLTESMPLGIRLPSKIEGEKDAIVLFALSQPCVGMRIWITYISNLAPAQVPTLLRALDEIAGKEGLTEGWIWDVDPASDLIQAWQEQDGRNVMIGRRADVDGHLLGVAWYGQDDGAKLLDGQMWSWC